MYKCGFYYLFNPINYNKGILVLIYILNTKNRILISFPKINFVKNCVLFYYPLTALFYFCCFYALQHWSEHPCWSRNSLGSGTGWGGVLEGAGGWWIRPCHVAMPLYCAFKLLITVIWLQMFLKVDCSIKLLPYKCGNILGFLFWDGIH